jgi:hypothetical protein
MFMQYVVAAFIWTTHPTLPLGFIASNQMYDSLDKCEERVEKDQEEFMAMVGNHVMTSSNPPIKVKKIFKIMCMTPIEATRLNLLLGHK